MNLKRFRNQSKQHKIKLSYSPQPSYFSNRINSPNMIPLANYSPLKQYNGNRIKDPQNQTISPSLSPRSASKTKQEQKSDLKKLFKAKPTGKTRQYKRKEQKNKQQKKPTSEQIQLKKLYQQKCKDNLFKYYYQKQIKQEPKQKQDSFQAQFPQVQSRMAKLAGKIQTVNNQLFRVKAQQKVSNPFSSTQNFLLKSENFRDFINRFNQVQQSKSREDLFQLKLQSKNRQSPYHAGKNQFRFDRFPRQNFGDKFFERKCNYHISNILKGYRNRESQIFKHLSKSISQLKICQTLKYSASYDNIVKVRKQSSVEQKLKHSGKKTVLFDLDETLICADQSSLATSRHQQIIKFYYLGKQYKLPVSIRPYARQIIKNIAQKCQVLVFTASAKDYAYAVCDYLDPERKYIEHIYHTEYVTPTSKKDIYGNTIKVKDLRIISRDLSQVVLVDNHAHSYGFQIENGIPIIDYWGDDDFELKELEKYLQNHIIPAKDVREVNRKFFKQHQFLNYEADQVIQLVQDLYKAR